jgi:hypothetical protein
MSKGILQLALMGKVPLQLEYQETRVQLQDLEHCTEPAEADTIGRDASCLTTCDSTFVEN